jgi:hypothetical protein
MAEGAAVRAESHGLAEALSRDSPADIEYARNWVPQGSSEGDGWAQALASVQPITGPPTAALPSWSQRVSEQLRSSTRGLYRCR